MNKDMCLTTQDQFVFGELTKDGTIFGDEITQQIIPAIQIVEDRIKSFTNSVINLFITEKEFYSFNLSAVIIACKDCNIPLTLWYYDTVTNNYVSKEILS